MTVEKGIGGRPKKAEDEQRSERLPGLRMTTAERHYIELMAERAGLSVAEYCRRAALGQTVRPARSMTDERTLAELNRVGVNLHQIVKALHFRQGIPNDIADTMAEVREAVERLADDGP